MTYYKYDLEITHDAGNNKNTGIIQAIRTHSLDDFRRHGIHEIGNDDDGAEQRHDAAQVFQGIIFYGFSHILAQRHFQKDIIPSFRSGHKQGQQEYHNIQPFGDFNVCDYAPGFYPEHKSCGQNKYIQDGYRF